MGETRETQAPQARQQDWRPAGKYTHRLLRQQQAELPAWWLLTRAAGNLVGLLAQQALQTDAPDDTVYRLDMRLVMEPRKRKE